jgi:hypothetical protein
MEEYIITISIKAKVEAPSLSDALDVMMDIFGPGSINGADVVEYEVLNHDGPE